MPTALITGGHAGLGLAAARGLRDAGWDLILAGRDPGRVGAAAASLGGTALAMDLASLASVRAAAAQVGPLDALLCNAGMRALGPARATADGYEETFAVNHLAHFLLVRLLEDRLNPGARVVFTASGTHDPATVDGLMVGRARRPDARALACAGLGGRPALSTGKRYTTSKLCNVMCAYELARRFEAAGKAQAAIAFDPGLMTDTGLVREFPGPAQAFMDSGFAKALFRAVGVTMGSVAFSGASLAKIATDPAYLSGRYYQSNAGSLVERRSSAVSYDEALAAQLWADSEALTSPPAPTP